MIDIQFYRVIGTTGRGPKWMVVEYGKLDARYWKTKDPTVMMVSYIEIVFMGPLCILWYAISNLHSLDFVSGHKLVRQLYFRLTFSQPFNFFE